MTRNEFLDIVTYDDLYNADYELGTYEFDNRNIQSYDSVTDVLDETIRSWTGAWWELRDYLDSFNENYYWYDCDNYYGPAGLYDGDETFTDIRDEILRRADEEGLFDDDDCENEVECQQEIREIHVIIEDFSMSDFL